MTLQCASAAKLGMDWKQKTEKQTRCKHAWSGPRTQECSAGGIIIMLLLHVNAQGHNGLQSAFKF